MTQFEVVGKLSRRTVLSRLMAGTLAPVRWAPGAAALVGYSRPVQAEPITIALTVASAAAALIAANNRSDGGMGAILKATLEYQRELARQLEVIQKNMEVVIVRLNSLPAEIQAILYQQRLSSMHSRIGAEVIRYKYESTIRSSTFSNYQAWTSDALTQSTLEDIDNQLQQAISQVESGKWFDPLTAIYVPVAAYAALGVRSARGEATEQLKVVGQRYLDLIGLCETSIETELRLRSSSINRLRAEISSSGLTIRDEDISEGQTEVWQRVVVTMRVEDMVPRQIVDYKEVCPGLAQDRDQCQDVPIYKESYLSGNYDEVYLTATIRSFILLAPLSSSSTFGIRQFEASESLEVKVNPFPDEWDPTVPLLRTSAPTTNDRQQQADASVEFASARVRWKETIKKLNELNFEISRSALCASTLTALSSTRLGISNLFRQ